MDDEVRDLDSRERRPQERSLGGSLRHNKSALVESLANDLMRMAWHDLGGDPRRLSINKRKLNAPIEPSYISKLPDTIQRHILSNPDEYFFAVVLTVACSC